MSKRELCSKCGVRKAACTKSYCPWAPTMADAIAAGDGTLHGAIDHWQARALKAESAAALLGELLAVIHRDGGHHQSAVGTEQAVKDAIDKFYAKDASHDR